MSPHRLAVIADVVRGAGPAVRTTTELDDALAGVDLVFTTLRVGGLDGRVQDERDALAAGVLGQETVGAGGLSAALRAVPVVDHVASRIAAVAPHAWTISMTNPAGVVTEAMAASLGDRVVGVCDSPAGLVRRACAAVDVDPGPSLADVTGRAAVDYVGLNHLGWLRALTVDGTDRLPALVVDPQRLATFEEGRLFGPDLIAALGTLPNEYLYWYYAAREAHRAVVDAGRTRGEHVREQQNAFYAAAAARARTGERPVGGRERRTQPQLSRRTALGRTRPQRYCCRRLRIRCRGGRPRADRGSADRADRERPQRRHRAGTACRTRSSRPCARSMRRARGRSLAPR